MHSRFPNFLSLKCLDTTCSQPSQPYSPLIHVTANIGNGVSVPLVETQINDETNKKPCGNNYNKKFQSKINNNFRENSSNICQDYSRCNVSKMCSEKKLNNHRIDEIIKDVCDEGTKSPNSICQCINNFSYFYVWFNSLNLIRKVN